LDAFGLTDGTEEDRWANAGTPTARASTADRVRAAAAAVHVRAIPLVERRIRALLSPRAWVQHGFLSQKRSSFGRACGRFRYAA
jgi:hypothetical protein